MLYREILQQRILLISIFPRLELLIPAVNTEFGFKTILNLLKALNYHATLLASNFVCHPSSKGYYPNFSV